MLRAELFNAEKEGKEAGLKNMSFSVCPYTFENAKVDQKTFDEKFRPLLDAWFNGWKSTTQPIPKKHIGRWHKQIKE